MVAVGKVVMVIVFDEVTCPHPPAAVMVLVTVYVPAVLVERFTCPVEVLTKFNPAVDEKIPATPPPLKVGDGFAAFEQ